MEPDDRDLVRRFLDGRDEDAFRALFRRHTPRLYGLTLRLVAGRRDEADDVVQEAWHRAAVRLRSFAWQSALSTWLAAIAINCARERRRANARAPGETTSSLADMPARLRRDGIDLDRAIARLPDGAREVLVLHDVEGYTHEEIAERLEIAVGTSKSQLSRARRLVRASLSGGDGKRIHEAG